MFKRGVYFNEARTDIDALAARFVVRDKEGHTKSFKLVVRKEESYLQERQSGDFVDLTRGEPSAATHCLLDILKVTGFSWDWEQFQMALMFFEQGKERGRHRL